MAKQTKKSTKPSAHVYGSGPVTPDTLTDEQIRALLIRTEAEASLSRGLVKRSNLTGLAGACRLALKSRIYRGSVRRICDVLNEEPLNPLVGGDGALLPARTRQGEITIARGDAHNRIMKIIQAEVAAFESGTDQWLVIDSIKRALVGMASRIEKGGR